MIIDTIIWVFFALLVMTIVWFVILRIEMKIKHRYASKIRKQMDIQTLSMIEFLKEKTIWYKNAKYTIKRKIMSLKNTHIRQITSPIKIEKSDHYLYKEEVKKK